MGRMVQGYACDGEQERLENQHPARGAPGFTLLETLLAIGLMSMIAAVLIGGSSTLLKSTVRSDPEDALRALEADGVIGTRPRGL